ncbi:MAG: agmatinase [Candidatus Omnitrophota bacterium]
MPIIFGGKDTDFTAFNHSKAVIVPVPYGKTVSYKKGTEHGPLAILKASDNLELFDEELNLETYKFGIATLPFLKVGGLKPEKMISRVEKNVSKVLEKEKFPIVIGGEHSVTIGAIKAVRKKHSDFSVLYFDAHSDLRDSYNHSKYNHACVARRILEYAGIVEVGIRSFSKEENDFSVENKLNVIKMLDVLEDKDIKNSIKRGLKQKVYISIDLDVFDPSIMPSVGTPEPGGMSWYGFLNILKEVIKEKHIVGFDVVELCPTRNMVRSDFFAAKLIYKTLGYIFSKKES